MPKIKKTSPAKEIAITNNSLRIPHVLFSFKYLTKNAKHSFAFFKKEFRSAHSAYKALFEKLQFSSRMTMAEFSGLSKETGYELLPFEQFPKSMQAVLSNTGIVTKDKKLAVMRFKNEEYRIICQPDVNHDNVWHVIGFDFDMSAYNHG